MLMMTSPSFWGAESVKYIAANNIVTPIHKNMVIAE